MMSTSSNHRQLGGKLRHLPADPLPDAVVASNGELLDAIVPDYLEWHWAEPPSVESLNPGLHRVTVKLVAHLEING